ncbi:MAG: ATP-binding cassette domain-containing protein, partial [Oscillospiraceae bacterium]
MLKAENITFAYTRSEKLFSNISFSLEKGGMLHILGPNGCGKTTLARCLLGLLKCSNGNITIND